jgi:hypothetical protein
MEFAIFVESLGFIRPRLDRPATGTIHDLRVAVRSTLRKSTRYRPALGDTAVQSGYREKALFESTGVLSFKTSYAILKAAGLGPFRLHLKIARTFGRMTAIANVLGEPERFTRGSEPHAPARRGPILMGIIRPGKNWIFAGRVEQRCA